MSWRRPGYRPGSHLVTDDRTGFTIWSHDSVNLWDGAIVHRRHFEARHPQDTIRARRENMRVADPRPEPVPLFTGPLVTTIAADEPGNADEYAPMGPLGAFALGQAEDDLGDQEESNAAGALSITVESTLRMMAGDRIGVYLDSGDLFMTIIAYVTGTTTLQMTDPLPGPVSAGNRVINYTFASVTTQ